jgi:hypothetical protein
MPVLLLLRFVSKDQRPHTHCRRYTDGTGRIALYRIPKGKVKGTCIFIHGCKHDPYSWFYRSKACPQCTGKLQQGRCAPP